MEILTRLDQKARSSLPRINDGVNIREYYQTGSGYLRQASLSKKSQDFENAYLLLKQYTILITELLPNHPMVSDPIIQDEYYFNKEKCTGPIATELENIKQEILKKHGGNMRPTPPVPQRANLPPPPSQRPNLPSPSQQNTNSTVSSGGGFMSSLGNIFGSKPMPPPPTTQSNLPPRNTLPPPPSNLPPNTTRSNLPPPPKSRTDQYAYDAMENIANNEQIQQKVGSGVANMAQNEQVQAKVGSQVSSMAKNEEYQRTVGNSLAEKTDNKLLQSLARNETIQRNMGSMVSKSAENKELQKKVGDSIAQKAQDKEFQQKVSKGFVTTGKGLWGGGKKLGGMAIEGGKSAYTNHQQSNQEEQE